MRTLIFSTSFDTTTDLLIHYLGSEKVFRFNADLWSDYTISFNGESLSISSPTLTINESDIAKVLWRKPIDKSQIRETGNTGAIARYHRRHIEQFCRELCEHFIDRQKLVLVDPAAEQSLTKLRQLRTAKQFFRTPKYELVLNRQPSIEGDLVAKSLIWGRVAEGLHFFTSDIARPLDGSSPWFVQQRVESAFDVTVVFIGGDILAFELDRDTFEGLDWRVDQRPSQLSNWRPCPLEDDEKCSIERLMAALDLSFGRIDFLRGGDGKLIFLEVNTNGQWAWLDLKNTNGLMRALLEEISPSSDRLTLARGRFDEFRGNVAGRRK